MLELLNNIWEWVEVNSEAIIGALSSLNLGGIVTNLLYARKQRKTISDNTVAAAKLNESTADLIAAKNEVTENTKETKALNEEVVKLRAENERLKETVEQSMSKVDTIIEILGVVYGTLKDETVRTAVQNIITNAKYSESTIRKQLKEQIEELQAKIAEDAELLKTQAKETVEKIESITNESHTSRY